jgi:hypothetical protein
LVVRAARNGISDQVSRKRFILPIGDNPPEQIERLGAEVAPAVRAASA